ncbi:MAG: CBS domain-containing protein [Rhodospirillaceae bacterium]|nr:CBS domain-containing protein [Rhodospirillaceae bacterium]
MDCKTVMAPIKVSIYADELASVVIDFMVEKHMGLVPVVERDGTFAGLISGDSLMAFMLPRTLTTMAKSHPRAGMHKVSFLNETAHEMQERLNGLRGRPISEMVDHNVDTVRPETPLIDALMMIKSKQYVVPVVDDENKLVGAISFFSVLYGLNEEYDREKAEKQKAAEREAREAQKHDQEGKQ